MSVETAKEPAYKATQEYKEILARHKSLVDKGEIALLEVIPANKTVFGGFGVIGKIKDKYRNLVLDTKDLEDRLWIEPAGATFRFDKEEDLRGIYAILHCPIYRNRCVTQDETPSKHIHRYILIDAEKESTVYAEKREESIKYMNLFYQMPEETINLLCNIAALPTKGTLGAKRADLCKVWENDADKKGRVKKMMDSPDIAYYEIAYWAIGQSNAQEGTGIYKTQNGVYKHNEQILGNSIDNVIAHLKMNDELFVALKKAKTPEAKPVAKPK